MNKLRWGILSTAKIGLEKVIPAMQRADNCRDRGHRLAQCRPRQASGRTSWAFLTRTVRTKQLLADPQVEAVYNPLPNHLHVPWSIAALEAGKHVLCEKPIGLSADEGQTLVDAAARFPKLKVMEAFMYRHHPQWQTARRLVNEGKIGTLRTIQTFFSYFNDDAQNIRNQADIGGGGLADIGCYCISLSRFLFGAEPRRVLGIVEYDPQFKTDRIASGILDFGRRHFDFHL